MGIHLISALATLADEIGAEVPVHNDDRSSVRVVVIPADLVSTYTRIFHDDVITVTRYFHVTDDLGVCCIAGILSWNVWCLEINNEAGLEIHNHLVLTHGDADEVNDVCMDIVSFHLEAARSVRLVGESGPF